MGEALLRSGDPAAAMASFSKAVEASPGAPAARVARGWARLRTRDAEGARADAEEALRLGSKDPAALVLRARARCSSGDVGPAQADVDAVLAKHPGFAPAFVALGDVLRERGSSDRAVEAYGRALALDPGLAEAHHHRANAERDRGRMEAAADGLDKAISLDGSDPYVHFDRGVVNGNRGAWNESEADFRRGLALGPTRPDWFWQRLWLARVKRGEGGGAAGELAAFVECRPEGTAGKLAPRINDLLLGRLPEDGFLALLERTEYSRKAIAEGYFFAAEKALADGRAARATELLRRCLRTGALTTSGYSTAEVELRSLGGPK
jgi:tetratricopeptide (TPR) repeat protein